MTWAQERRKANLRARESRAHKKALRVEIDGRMVASADGINPLPPEYHGSHSLYTNWLCRCSPCTEVATTYMREYHENRKRER